MQGRWTYLYRAIDREGDLVDVVLSEKRDKAAAEAFLRSARTVTDSVPERVTIDGHDAYPGAIKTVPGGNGTPSYQPLLEQPSRARPSKN